MALRTSHVWLLPTSKCFSQRGCHYKSQTSSQFLQSKISPLKIEATANAPGRSIITDDKEIKTVGSVRYPKLLAWESVSRERWQGELEVDGSIPGWLDGTYLRNGPGMYHIGDYKLKHVFDGYAMLVRLRFQNGQVVAGHAQLQSESYKTAKKHNKLCYREYAVIPKASNFFSYVAEIVGQISGKSVTDNANISVIRLGDGRVLSINETMKGCFEIDPNTLETIGQFNYSDNLGGLLDNSHPFVSETELISFIVDVMRPGYNIVRMLAGTNERTLLGRVNCKNCGLNPSWVHSFPVTDNYIIIPETPFKYCNDDILSTGSEAKRFKWHPQSKAFAHVVSRSTGETVVCVEMPLFVTFHFINGYEERDEHGKAVAVIADCCEYYSDSTIIDRMKLEDLRSFSGVDVLPYSRVARLRIPLDGSPFGELETALPPREHGEGIDTCTVNPKYAGKSYRYAYGCGAHRPCNFINTLTKIDLKEKKAKSWYEEGAVPSEPFFVGRPGAETEDDGVVISLVSDRNGVGFALVLDACSFREIGRARLPYGLPWGSHGCWIPSSHSENCGI